MPLKVHAMSLDEIKSLAAAIPESWQRCMVVLTFWHGFRVSEVVGGWSVVKKQKVYHEPMTAANFTVTPKDVFVTVQRLKGSNKTVQKLFSNSDSLLDEKTMVLELLKTAEPGKPLFPISRFGFFRLLRRIGPKVGIPLHKCHPHALKHSIGKQSAKNGAGVENIRTWLGHKSYVTMDYMRSDEEEAQQAIAAAVGQ